MLQTLKFVRGAVSNKDLVPVLTHFCIADGRIQGQNGRIALDAPCDELRALSVAAPADKFLKAVDACEADPIFDLKDGQLIIHRGRFRAKMGALPIDQYPMLCNDSAICADHREGFKLLDTLMRLEPFISTDASRPWSCSVMIDNGVAVATNNVTLAVTDFEWGCSRLVLPAFTVDELIRIGRDPTWVHWDRDYFIAEYDDGSWLRSQLIGGEWPDMVWDLVKSIDDNDAWVDVPSSMVHALERLKPFFPDAKQPVVVMTEEGIATQDGHSSAQVQVDGLSEGAFRLESLALAASHARQWNLGCYPRPVPWRSASLRGLLVGVRL